MGLLRQNSELRADRIWNWTLPAWVVQLSDGTNFNVCPNAGACAKVCYARNGTFNFRNVKQAHVRNLEMVLHTLPEWTEQMCAELAHKRFLPTGIPRLAEMIEDLQPDGWTRNWLESGGAAVRIHDSGDFFSDEYLQAWLYIARQYDHILFYAYTKEVERFNRLVEGIAPSNFKWVYSMGGKQDYLINKDTQRHADVFPTMEALQEAGYTEQTANDLLAVLLPTTRIGVPANNIPAFRKLMFGKSFAQLQEARNRKKTDV